MTKSSASSSRNAPRPGGFRLIGFDLPFGRPDGPAIPIGRIGAARVAVFQRENNIVDVRRLPRGCVFTLLNVRQLRELSAFDHRTCALFVCGAERILFYRLADEASFFRQLLEDKSLFEDDPYFRLSLAKLTGTRELVRTELFACVRRRSFLRHDQAAAVNDTWYRSEIDELPDGFEKSRLPRSFADAVRDVQAETRAWQIDAPKFAGLLPGESGALPEMPDTLAYVLHLARPSVLTDIEFPADVVVAAFDERLRGRLVKTAKRRGLADEDAEDLAQDVLTTAFDEITTGAHRRRESNVGSFVWAVFDRKLREGSSLRAHGKAPVSAEREVTPRELPDQDLRVLVREVFATLTPRERIVLLLNVQQGLPAREIAKILGLGIKTTESILTAAKKRFAARIRRK